jgi:hypothetical protein
LPYKIPAYVFFPSYSSNAPVPLCVIFSVLAYLVRVYLKFSSAFAKLRKETFSVFMSGGLSFVYPSVRMEQLGSKWTDFQEIWYRSIFRKSVEKIQGSLKYDKNNGYITCKQIHILIITHSVLTRMRNVSDKIVEGIKTHILCSITFY